MSSSDITLIILSGLSVLASVIATFLSSIVSKEMRQIEIEKKQMREAEEIYRKAKITVPKESLKKIGVQLRALPKNNGHQIIQVEGKRVFPNTGTD